MEKIVEEIQGDLIGTKHKVDENEERGRRLEKLVKAQEQVTQDMTEYLDNLEGIVENLENNWKKLKLEA